MLDEEGGLPGVHMDKLQGVLGRIDSAILYEEINDLYEIAALYAITIAQGHPFNDANKRTAMTCMLMFLRLNHIICMPPNQLIPDFLVNVAEKRLKREEIAEWLRQHSVNK